MVSGLVLFSRRSELKKPFATDLKFEGKPDYGRKDYRNSDMSLTLRSFARRLYLSDNDDVVLLGAASQIDEILKRRKSSTRFLSYNWIVALLAVFAISLDILFDLFFHLPKIVYNSLLTGTTPLTGEIGGEA